MQKMELLMPAGSPRKLELALSYGADAVYFGPPLFSLRARQNDFTLEEMQKSIAFIKDRGAKGYMTLNIFARNRKLKSFREAIPMYRDLGVDALIGADPGLAMVIREIWPEAEIHLSVQANCMNYEAVKFWHKSLGVSRVILSRELSIEEITETKQRVPEMELEAFVHGSICIAYSGRCLMSSYMSHRDANQGVCDNSCREKFKVHDHSLYIEDLRDEGSIYSMEEDEHGTYIMNAKDLCMIEHLDKLRKAGVCSLKVEGRTKSESYASIVARAYRGAIDDLFAGKDFNPSWLKEIEKLGHRGFHTGFMIQDPADQGQNYKSSFSHNPDYKFAALVNQPLSSGWVEVEVKNKLELGQTLEIIEPSGQTKCARLVGIRGQKGETRENLHSGMGTWNLNLEGVTGTENQIHVMKNSWIGYGVDPA